MLVLEKLPFPLFTTTISAFGASPVYFDKADPFPAAVPATCVPCPSVSFSRTKLAGDPSISFSICAWVYSTP